MPPSLKFELPSKSPLKSVIPNLMPFKINYTGPASISLYFRPKIAPSRVAEPAVEEADGHAAPQEAQSSSLQLASTSTATLVEEDLGSTAENSMDVDSTSTSQDTLVAESQVQSSSSASMSTLASVSMASIPESTIQTTANPAFGEQTGSETSSQPRFIASFRGRTVQGLELALPEGYSGVVLKQKKRDVADGFAVAADEGEKKSSSKAQVKSSRMSPSKRRTRGNPITDVDEEAEDVDSHASSLIPEEDAKIMQLESQFSSLMIWHPDNPVNEGEDEYARALNEWTRLTAVVHDYDED